MDRKLQFCQTCLCKDRQLYPLARLKDSLTGFGIKLNMLGGVCWECKWRIIRQHKFRKQAKRAQYTLKRLKSEIIQPLSTLTISKGKFYYSHEDPVTHTTITCHETGPIMIKLEPESANENQGMDTGLVKIITRDKTNMDIVYEIEEHLDAEDHEWYNNDYVDDDNDDTDWTCNENDYQNQNNDFNERVQRQIVTMEREKRMNANNIDEKSEQDGSSLSNKNNIDHLIENIKMFASQSSEDIEDRLKTTLIKNKNKGQVIREEHNYCQTVSGSPRSLGDSQIVLDHHMSDLPRITMVESIQDQPTFPSKEPVDFTEIIELNISIPIPESSGCNDSAAGNVSNITKENITEYTYNKNSLEATTFTNEFIKHSMESNTETTNNTNISNRCRAKTMFDKALMKACFDVNSSSSEIYRAQKNVNQESNSTKDKNKSTTSRSEASSKQASNPTVSKSNSPKDKNEATTNRSETSPKQASNTTVCKSNNPKDKNKATTRKSEANLKHASNATIGNVHETNSKNNNIPTTRNVIVFKSKSPNGSIPVSSNKSNDTENASAVNDNKNTIDKKDEKPKNANTSKNKSPKSNNNSQSQIVSPSTSKQVNKNSTSKEVNSEDVLSQIDALINKELNKKKTVSQDVENEKQKEINALINKELNKKKIVSQDVENEKQKEMNALINKELNKKNIVSQEGENEKQKEIDALINKELNKKKTLSQDVENKKQKDGKESNPMPPPPPPVQKSKEKDTITVKVKYLANPPCDTQGVRIKTEPISDEEDCIVVNEEASVNISQMRPIEPSTSHDNLSSTINEDKLQQYLWRRSVLLVYNRLRAHKYASTFAHAVSDTIAPDYSTIVKRPQNLVGIRKNIFNGTVRTTSEFHRDLLLMLTNALMYNSSDSSVFHMAKDFFEEAKYQLEVLRTVHDESTLPSDTTTPRPKSKRRQDLEEKLAKRPRLTETLIVPKIEKPDKKSKSKSKILPNPLSASRRVKKEKTVENIEKEVGKRGRRRKQQEKTPITVKTEMIKAEVKKVSENCLLIGSKIVPVPDSSDNDDVHISSTGRVSKLNDKYFSADYCNNSKSNVDVKPKISELVTPVKRGRGRPPRNATKEVKDEIITSTVKRAGRKCKKDVGVKERFEKLAKMPNLSPIVKLEPISVEQADTFDDYCVAITTEPQRDLTHDEASSIKKLLEEKILQIALDFSKFAPRFRGKPIIADGVVKLWCEDAPSLKWLKKTVSEFKGGFVVRKQTELPKKIKCAISIPGSNGDMVVTEKILAAQNPWAQVASWAFYSSEQRGESMTLVIGIPSTLIPVILSRQRRLAYILGSVQIKFYNSEDKLTDSPNET